MRPEETVEQHLRSRVEAAGGMCIKFAPTRAGVPDRLVILPGGRLFLVELKAARGRLRPIQEVWHRRARRIGLLVPVLHTKAAVDRWLDAELRDVL